MADEVTVRGSAKGFAQEITVLVQGAVFAHGAPAAIAADPRVREVYLGQSRHG